MNLTHLRSNLGDIVNQAAFTSTRTAITRHGKAIAAIIPIDDLELLEALEERADIEAFDRSMAEDDGTTVSLDTFLTDHPA